MCVYKEYNWPKLTNTAGNMVISGLQLHGNLKDRSMYLGRQPLFKVESPRSTLFNRRADAKSDIPPNIAPKMVTPENYLQIWDSSATLIGQLAIVTLFGAILGGIPLSGPYP